MEIKTAIEILEKIKQSCWEEIEPNGKIVYAVGGIESVNTNYREAITFAVKLMERIDEGEN